MTLESLLGTWALIAACCAVACAVARLAGQRLNRAERMRETRQWREMCEALDAEHLARETQDLHDITQG